MTPALAWAWSAFAAIQAPVEFPSRIDLVTLDAVVVDGRGRPVSDLARDEFVVREDGVPREIVSFERFGDAPTPARVEAAASPNPRGAASPEPRPGGVFALIVDDQGLAGRELEDTRDAIVRFVATLRDGDEVTLAATSGAAWWTTTLPEGREDLLAIAGRLRGQATGASLAFDHISDYEAFAIRDHEDAGMISRVVRRWTVNGACVMVQGRQDPGCPSRVRAMAAAVDGMRRKRTRSLLATLRRTLEAFAPHRGRKSILLFSRGFLQDSDSTAQEGAARAREANAAVYFIDARGLQAAPGLHTAADAGAPDSRDFVRMGAEAGALESGGAQALASETGGVSFRNTNDLGAAAALVADEARAYYLLGFLPRSDRKPGDWRRLAVEVTRPGVSVRTRKGYTLAAGTPEPPDRQAAAGKPSAAMTAALDSPRAVSGIPLRARAFVFEPRPKDRSRVLIAAEFDASGLRFEGRGAERAARLALGVAVTHRDTGVTQELHEQVVVRAGEADAPRWRSVAREVDLAAGTAQARVVLRDPEARLAGAVSHRFEVPSPDALRVTTPIVTDRVQRSGADDDHPRAAIVVARVFRPRGPLYCEFEVLGAKTEGRVPRVSAGIEVRAADGRTVRHAPPTPIAPDGGGRLLRLVGIVLDGLPEGDYRLVLDVRDQIAGTRLERVEPFTLRESRD